MGQKHRDTRKKLKAEAARLRRQGFKENEFGELVSVSKARRRLAFIGKAHFFIRAEREIVDLAQRRALEDIQRIEDARILGI